MADNSDYPYALEMVNIEKYFGLVCALKNINLQVGRNEIVGLIGDNGAGKSNMVKILTGVHQPTSGELYVAGRKVDSSPTTSRPPIATESRPSTRTSPWARSRCCGAFFIGRQITRRLGFIDVKKEKEIVNEIMLNTIGFRGKGITVDPKVNKLSGGERQGVAIGRAMHFEAELIVLDEPTVALSLKEVRKVLNFVHKIKEAGKACVYISHSIQDVYEISDRFVVLTVGRLSAASRRKTRRL